MYEILTAVKYVHSHNIVHRELKVLYNIQYKVMVVFFQRLFKVETRN